MKRAFFSIILMMVCAASLSASAFGNGGGGNGVVQKSKASFYHDKFNGKKTASGEIFSNKKFTAAHRTLPFGTLVKVTNLKNGNSVVVRINDRIPFQSDRALDLSKAAFEKIAHMNSGIISISYEVLDGENN